MKDPHEKNNDRIGRRRALVVLGAVAAVPLAGAGCGGGDDAETTDTFSCENPSGLSTQTQQLRESQSYVDESTTEGERCSNCTHYTAAAAGECGSCAVLQESPVHPDGWCQLWTAAQA